MENFTFCAVLMLEGKSVQTDNTTWWEVPSIGMFIAEQKRLGSEVRNRSMKVRDQSRKVNELSKVVRDQFRKNRLRDRHEIPLPVLNGFKGITFYFH